MPGPVLQDVACALHVHSTHSDGTGTVDEIAAAAARADVDVVLLTDHDTLAARRRGEEGWHGGVLVIVGEEVSPPRENHLLAFGLAEPIDHRGLRPAEIAVAVKDGGGFGIAAHPFSRGFPAFGLEGAGMPWRDLDAEALTGVELWNFSMDTAESLGGLADGVRFLARPERVLERPPAHNIAAWERMCASRPVVAVGGLDAHQQGLRLAGRVVLRALPYSRAFRLLRTHVLVERALGGESAEDSALVLAALRRGRCFMANDLLAPSGGFAFWGERGGSERLEMGETAPAAPHTLRLRVPRAASLALFADGVELARRWGTTLSARVEAPGVYRVEATLPAWGRERLWILSNPIYLR